MWAQISPDKTLQNAASNCEEMKGATASLAKTTVIFCLLVNFADFFFVLYIFADFFAFISFSLVFCFMVFLCGAALSFFGLSTSDLEHATGSRPPNMT